MKAPVYCEPRSLGCSEDLFTDSLFDALTKSGSVFRNHVYPLLRTDGCSSLTSLSPDELSLVHHTLSLVRFRWPEGTYLRCHLTDKLLVKTADGNVGRLRDFYFDSLRRTKQNRMRKPKRQLKLFASQFRLVTHTDDLKFLLEAFRNPLHHVINQRPPQTMESRHGFLVRRPGTYDLFSLNFNLNGRVNFC